MIAKINGTSPERKAGKAARYLIRFLHPARREKSGNAAASPLCGDPRRPGKVSQAPELVKTCLTDQRAGGMEKPNNMAKHQIKPAPGGAAGGPRGIIVAGRKRHELTLADVGALVLRDAEDTVRQQIQQTITRQAEHVLGRIQYWRGQIDKDKHMLAEFERKRKAIEAGEFQVNKYDGTVTFNDHSLETLG